MSDHYEDTPTPDDAPQEGPFDFPLLTPEKDLDAAVARVFLKSLQILPWLAHIHKLLCDAAARRDWSKVSKAEDSVKLLTDHLSQNGGVR